MTVTVENLQKRIRLNLNQLLKDVKKVLAHEQIEQAELSVALVTDRKMKVLHQKYLGLNYPTDVLTFDFLPPKLSKTKQPKKTKSINGEIVISTDMAVKQAKEFHASAESECYLYIIHGILHLLGYDDHRPSDIKKMRKKEAELMNVIKREIA